MSDPYALQRFVDAQDHGVYDEALRELGRGSKRGHWMWFVFPQVNGLGRSATARQFACPVCERPRPTWRIRCSAPG